MCHDVMAEGRQRGGILQEGVCKGGRGLQILCLDLHSYEPSASGSIQTQGRAGTKGTGDTICQFLLLSEQIICTHYHFICVL